MLWFRQKAFAQNSLDIVYDKFVWLQVEKLIKELPSVPTDWSNGDVNLSERNNLSNGVSAQHVENEMIIRETQSMLLERIASEMNRLKYYVTHAKVCFNFFFPLLLIVLCVCVLILRMIISRKNCKTLSGWTRVSKFHFVSTLMCFSLASFKLLLFFSYLTI